MTLVFKTLLFLHIAAGFSSLILFWIPIFTRKGGKNHRRVGKIYVYFMWVVVATAAILCIKNLVIGDPQKAAFLGFISLITASPLWHGISVLKYKKGLTENFRTAHLAFKILIVLASFALIGYGIALGGKGSAILMFVFGGLGVADIPGIVRSIKNPPVEAQWLKDHIVGMCITAIAAYTAFFVFGANQFFNYFLPGNWAIIPWVAPTLVGTFGIRWSVRKYRKKGLIK